MDEVSEKELFENVPVHRAVAAYGIVKRIDLFPLGICMGLCQGFMPPADAAHYHWHVCCDMEKTNKQGFEVITKR